jgi:hypothetical protein
LGPGNPVLLVRLGDATRFRAAAGTAVPLPGAPADPDDTLVLLLDPAALAAGVAGWGPVTVSPTPTARDSLEAFLRTVWQHRPGLYVGQQTVYSVSDCLRLP